MIGFLYNYFMTGEDDKSIFSIPGMLGTLFDPCRVAYLTYTSNGSVRPLSL
jgi:hypothetical protein